MRVHDPGQQVGRPRSARRRTHAGSSARPRVARGGVGRPLLMTDRHVVQVRVAVQRVVEVQDRPTCVAEHRAHAVRLQGVADDLAAVARAGTLGTAGDGAESGSTGFHVVSPRVPPPPRTAGKKKARLRWEAGRCGHLARTLSHHTAPVARQVRSPRPTTTTTSAMGANACMRAPYRRAYCAVNRIRLAVSTLVTAENSPRRHQVTKAVELCSRRLCLFEPPLCLGVFVVSHPSWGSRCDACSPLPRCVHISPPARATTAARLPARQRPRSRQRPRPRRRPPRRPAPIPPYMHASRSVRSTTPP